MKKIIKSAEQVFNESVENLERYGEYYYDPHSKTAYWKEDEEYCYADISSPDYNDLREVLDMLNDNGWNDLDDALRFYDYGDHHDDEWKDYLEWYIGENGTNVVEAETEEYDVKVDYSHVADYLKGLTFDKILKVVPEDRRKHDGYDSLLIEYNGLSFTIVRCEDGKVALSGEVTPWNKDVFVSSDVDYLDYVIIYDPVKDKGAPKEYGMDKGMQPFADIISSIKNSIIKELLEFESLSIDPYFSFKNGLNLVEDYEWDVVAISKDEDDVPQLSFIQGTLEEPSLSVNIDLVKLPVEELIRLYNSVC